MKRINKLKDKVLLHPIMAFLLLTGLVIVASGILDLFDVSVTYNKLNPKTGNYEATLVAVESLLNLSGVKFIFSTAVKSFAEFTPLVMLLISLIGLGILDRSGFLDSLFFVLTKKLSKTVVTFVFALICMMASITGNMSFIVLIPLAALLFKYGKRNPNVGIIMSFASISTGYGINVLLNSVDSRMINMTLPVADKVSSGYEISTFSYLIIMFVALFVGASLITYVTEKIIAPKFGKYKENDEEVIVDKEKLTKKERKGLLFASIGGLLYVLVIVYNIIPNVPLGGNLLDSNGLRYIDKLFGDGSFFNDGFVFVITFLFVIVGVLYGIGTDSINNQRDICNYLSHSLDGIGKPIVLLFFASTFISLLKQTQIGLLITASLANLFDNVNFTGIPLMLLLLLIGIVTTFLNPTISQRWEILAGTVVPTMMSSGFSAEAAQLIFTAGATVSFGLTPAMAYFVIYVSFLEKYGKDDVGLTKSISYIIPYALLFLAMWVCLFIIWYLVGIPIGIGTNLTL